MTTNPAPGSLHADVAAGLAGHPAVRLAILYGSVARETAGAESDLDLGVMDLRPLPAAEKVALIEDLARATGRPVDTIAPGHAEDIPRRGAVS